MRFNYRYLAAVWLLAGGCAVTGGTPRAGDNDSTAEARELVAIMEQNFQYDESFTVARGGMVHYMQAGETISGLAQKSGMSVADLLAINNIQDPRTIQVGTRIYIPAATSLDKKRPTEVAAVDAPEVPLQTATPVPGTGDEESSATESSKNSQTAQVTPPGRGMGSFRDLCWPVSGGQISSRFGQRWGRNHDGLDLPGPEGAPVMAAEAGEVILSTFNEGGYGNLIIIKHKDGWFTVYAHNKQNLVKKGDRVKRCEKIAKLGNTGRSTGPHCHFEVREGKTPQNPILFLEP